MTNAMSYWCQYFYISNRIRIVDFVQQQDVKFSKAQMKQGMALHLQYILDGQMNLKQEFSNITPTEAKDFAKLFYKVIAQYKSDTAVAPRSLLVIYSFLDNGHILTPVFPFKGHGIHRLTKDKVVAYQIDNSIEDMSVDHETGEIFEDKIMEQVITDEQLAPIFKLLKIYPKDNMEDNLVFYRQFQNLYFNDGHNDFMLRDWLEQNGTIVISRIFLENQHQGIGTKLIQRIEQITNQHKGKRIVIESVLSEAMATLATKLGYKQDPYAPMNYVKNI